MVTAASLAGLLKLRRIESPYLPVRVQLKCPCNLRELSPPTSETPQWKGGSRFFA